MVSSVISEDIFTSFLSFNVEIQKMDIAENSRQDYSIQGKTIGELSQVRYCSLTRLWHKVFSVFLWLYREYVENKP